jgi:hypothetical protein
MMIFPAKAHADATFQALPNSKLASVWDHAIQPWLPTCNERSPKPTTLTEGW